MAEDREAEPKKKDEDKLEFTPEGESLGYISLDQARVLAIQHARDNREAYGRFADRDLVWEVTSAQETEDYYEIRLSHVPAPPFNGTPGVELYTIDKIGGVELRQMLTPPRPRRSSVPALALISGLSAVVIAVAVLFTAGVFSLGGVTGMAGGSVSAPVSESSMVIPVDVLPDEPSTFSYAVASILGVDATSAGQVIE